MTDHADAAMRKLAAQDDMRALRAQLGIFGALGVTGLVFSYLHILEAVRQAGVDDWTAWGLAAMPDVFVVALAFRALWLASRKRPHGPETAATLGFLGATLAANLYVAPELTLATLLVYGAPAIVAAVGFLFAELALRDTRAARSVLAELAAVEAAPKPRQRRQAPRTAPAAPAAAPSVPEVAAGPEERPERVLRAVPEGQDGPQWPRGDAGRQAAHDWLTAEVERTGQAPTYNALMERTGNGSSWCRGVLAEWRRIAA